MTWRRVILQVRDNVGLDRGDEPAQSKQFDTEQSRAINK